MARDNLIHSYSFSKFANREHCQQILADTNVLGSHWIKLTNELDILGSVRGIYLVSLVSPYQLTAQENTISFRNILYINMTEDIRTIFSLESLLSPDVAAQLMSKYENVPFELLSDLELWFLPIPGASRDLIGNLLTNLNGVFNPPCNPSTVKPLKANTATNLSAPAF